MSQELFALLYMEKTPNYPKGKIPSHTAEPKPWAPTESAAMGKTQHSAMFYLLLCTPSNLPAAPQAEGSR